MPEICRFYGITIYMFHNDHNPPHFHIQYGGKFATFDLYTGDIVGGETTSRVRKMIKEWVKAHKIELIEDWNLVENMAIPKRIEPLI